MATHDIDVCIATFKLKNKIIQFNVSESHNSTPQPVPLLTNHASKLDLPRVQTIPLLEQFKTVPLLAPSPITWKNLSGSKFSKPLKILKTSIRSARRKLKKYCILRRRLSGVWRYTAPNIGKIALIGRYNWKTSEWENSRNRILLVW